MSEKNEKRRGRWRRRVLICAVGLGAISGAYWVWDSNLLRPRPAINYSGPWTQSASD